MPEDNLVLQHKSSLVDLTSRSNFHFKNDFCKEVHFHENTDLYKEVYFLENNEV